MTNYVGKKVLVRGVQSGVYFGELVSQDKQEVEMKNVRNLWRWNGANTLLDLAETVQKKQMIADFLTRLTALS